MHIDENTKRLLDSCAEREKPRRSEQEERAAIDERYRRQRADHDQAIQGVLEIFRNRAR